MPGNVLPHRRPIVKYMQVRRLEKDKMDTTEKEKEIKKCSVWWCDNPHYAKGFCHTHWTAKRRYGSPFGKNPNAQLRSEILFGKANRIAEFILEGYLKMDTSKGCPMCNSSDPDTHNKDCLILDAYLIVNMGKQKENG